MQWLNKLVDEIISKHDDNEILVESGVSPSGKYHLGTLREVLTAEVISRELKRRGKKSRHIHFVDDLDALRKIPAGVPEDFQQHLGKSLYAVPSPGGSAKSYADYYLDDLIKAGDKLKLDMEVLRSHEQYQNGFFIPSVELALENIDEVRRVLETISGHKLGEEWSPIQVNEDGYLKKRSFINLDKNARNIEYKDKDGQTRTASYQKAEVKLDWRIDWPARWWLLGIDVEPFGRDHATKGGSYDTGAALMDSIFNATAPSPVPYAFINRAGETKKMSKSAGDTVDLSTLLEILPPEVVWFFVIRYSPEKQLFFNEDDGVVRLIDEFAELRAKSDKSEDEKQLLELCLHGIDGSVSSVPFSHLVASYQAALKNSEETIELLKRTGQYDATEEQTVKKQLVFIDNWLKNWAPEDVKFELADNIEKDKFSEKEKEFINKLAIKIESSPGEADGEWFHKAIYELKDELNLEPKEAFSALYSVLINKNSGPRAGWFLSILPKDWLIKRLKFEV